MSMMTVETPRVRGMASDIDRSQGLEQAGQKLSRALHLSNHPLKFCDVELAAKSNKKGQSP